MLTEKVTYKDLNGNDRTEILHFNLSKAEVIEWEMRVMDRGGLVKLLEEVEEAKDGKQIMDFFRDLIQKSYGIKAEDGRGFRKSSQIYEEFIGSEAYSELFMGLIYNPEKAAEFASAILPKDLAEAVAKIPTTVENNSSIPAHVAQPQDYRRNRTTNPAKEAVVESTPSEDEIRPSFDGEIVGSTTEADSLDDLSIEELKERLRNRQEG